MRDQRKERKKLVKRGEAALHALALSVSTKADHARVDLVRRAMLALDGEQADTKHVNDALAAVAKDWLNVLDSDGTECTCLPGDICPRCRCIAALKLAGAGR